jgi:uncharacterized protein (TIGR03437 family)
VSWFSFSRSLVAFIGVACSAQTVVTIAGTVRGYAGDGGPAANAQLALANLQNECDPNRLEQTVHLSVDAPGNIYIADSNNQRIRRIDTQGAIATVAGSGSRPTRNSLCESTGTVGDGSDARAALLYNPADVAVLSNGSLVIADQQNNRIRLVTSSGAISTIAGSGLHNLYAPGIAATASPMDWPSAVVADSTGIIYFAEMHSNRVGKIGLDGKLVTVAGTGFPGYNGDRIQANTAQLRKPSGLALDSAGNLYIADQGNHRVRKVAPGGIITTIAGTGQADFSGDGGPANAAALNSPMDVKVDAHGTIYIADTLNNRVRRIDTNGIITTVAQDLNSPAGLAVDGNGDLYIADWQNYLIKKLVFSLVPVVATGGIVNAASFDPAVAPGSLFSIFGLNLGSATSVAVNGVKAPVYFVSDQQINAQLPVELTAGSPTLSVANSTGTSNFVSVNVVPAAPGIFQINNRAVAQNQDGTLNSAANPESRGRAIVLYLTGQGPVNPPIATAQAAPGDLRSATLPFSGTVGGTDANVFFLGLTPGFIGLAQANLIIPANAPTGDAPVVITVNGQRSNSVIVSVQ